MNASVFSLFAVVVGCTVLVACAPISEPARQALQVPVRYGQEGSNTESLRGIEVSESIYPAHDITTQTWWESYEDSRLDRLIDQAFKVNSDLASAALALRRARLQAGLARNDQLPQLSASVNADASRNLARHDSVQHASSANVALSWEVDFWGRLAAARDVAQWEAQATEQDRETIALALVGEVCEQYWGLAYLNQSIGAGQTHIEHLTQILALVRVQFNAGGVSLLNVREAEQNLESELSAQSQLVQQRAEARNALSVLLDGQEWSRSEEPANLNDAGDPPLTIGIPAQVLGRRPDLRAAELRLRKSLASIKATARSYYPALTLTGSAGTSSTSLSDVLRNPLGTLGAGLTLPFLNVQRMRLETDSARLDYEIAVSDFRGKLYTALKEVDNALSARGQLLVQGAAAKRSFEAAQDVERMYGVRYRAGAVDLRTWLDAQQTLRDAELALAQIRRDQLLNDVKLHLALGGDSN